jgi:hypothetical protein
MKVGYMTGVLMGATSSDSENVSYKPKETFDVETDQTQSYNDGSNESSSNSDDSDDSSSDSGSYTFLNTKMIAYVIIGLVLFKAFKK